MSIEVERKVNNNKRCIVFMKPINSRDKGLIRICESQNNIYSVKIINSLDDYELKYQNEKIHKNDDNIYYGIIPIMYLSEWNMHNNNKNLYLKWYNKCLIRGFPRLQILSHKGNLCNLINKFIFSNDWNKHIKINKNEYIQLKNDIISFYPKSYFITKDHYNDDYKLFKNDNSNNDSNNDNKIKWITKPQGKSKGNGIRLYKNWSDIDLHNDMVISKYIANPLLINNKKFDLRLYVLILSIKPLQVYVHEVGMIRFASFKYNDTINSDFNYQTNMNQDDNDLKEDEITLLCSHLTNYTLNKKHPIHKKKLNDNQDTFGVHSDIKWTLKQFWSYMENKYKQKPNIKEHIMKQIYNIVRIIFKCGQQRMLEKYNEYFYNKNNNNNIYGKCFDLMGIDILIDTNLSCWLMEFNRYPSLKCDKKN